MINVAVDFLKMNVLVWDEFTYRSNKFVPEIQDSGEMQWPSLLEVPLLSNG
jgi:hypothetical protein